jgi:hypothetical protein
VKVLQGVVVGEGVPDEVGEHPTRQSTIAITMTARFAIVTVCPF